MIAESLVQDVRELEFGGHHVLKTKDLQMTRRPIDSVQIAGWTPDAVTRAVRLLAVGPCADPDEGALAQELLRRLRCAADEDAEDLADYIETIRSSGANESVWAKLLRSLSEEPLSETVVRLYAERSDFVGELCALLDEVTEQRVQFDRLDHEDQRAVKALLVLGAAEGLCYLLRHISLLCWNDVKALEQLVHPHREAFVRAALDVWDSLSWGDRATLVLTFADLDLPSTPLVELLLAVDGEALDYQDRTRYVHALDFTEHAHATPRIHHLLDRALEAYAQLSADGRQFVLETVYCCGRDGLTAEQCRRAAEWGIRVPGCGDAV